MPPRPTWVAAALLLATAGSAHALKPGTHADLAKQSCLDAGLAANFCKRIATENYVTDSREWEDLRAHAQIDSGETACVAADRTAERLWQLGADLRGQLEAARLDASWDNVGKSGAAVGRALHTIQDNCAHHGMPNPQHAWFSMSDFCHDTELSPDVQSDAKTCADVETDAIMSLVAEAVRARGLGDWMGARSCPPAAGGPRSTEIALCDKRFLPGPVDACRFLATAKDWDGVDRTWENAIVTGSLREAFAAGLAGEPMMAPICGGDESLLSPAMSEPILDISVGVPSCTKAKLFCLGKADEADHPFHDDEESIDEDTGGCSTGHGDAGAMLMLILGLLIARQRRSVR